MNRIYLNELSLEGQFKNFDSFFDEIKPVIKCLKYVKEQGEKIYKSSDFYERKITPDKTWNDVDVSGTSIAEGAEMRESCFRFHLKNLLIKL